MMPVQPACHGDAGRDLPPRAHQARHGREIAGKGAHGGSSVRMAAPGDTGTAVLARRLWRDPVLIEPGAPLFAAADLPRNRHRLDYSAIPTERIEAGMARIADALAQAPAGG